MLYYIILYYYIVCMDVCMHVCMYACMYAYMCIYIYIYIHMYSRLDAARLWLGEIPEREGVTHSRLAHGVVSKYYICSKQHGKHRCCNTDTTCNNICLKPPSLKPPPAQVPTHACMRGWTENFGVEIYTWLVA